VSTESLAVGAPVELAGPSPVAPVADADRLSALDVLRGVALLGILLMNIHEFGGPWRGMHAEFDPSRRWATADLAFSGLSHVFFEGKMRGLFSLLFGAGVILLTSRGESRGGGIGVADLYYRRNLWLIAFGLAHAYFIWDGDILFGYGVTGLLLFPFRKLRPAALIALGVVLLGVPVATSARAAREVRHQKAEAALADRAAAAGRTLTEAQRDAQKEWAETLKGMEPSAEKVAKQVADHRGSYSRLFAERAGGLARSQPVWYYQDGVFDVGGMMLIGMGLMRLGVLAGGARPGVYLGLMAVGYGVGVPLNAWTGYRIWASHFDMFTRDDQSVWFSPGRLAVTLANLGLILWVRQRGWLPGLTARLEAVGRMALTNYLGTSLACTLIFNGYGLGYYGRLRGVQLLTVVAGVWAVQLWLSPVWLRHFRYGPAEWAWRSLSHWRVQPLRVDRATAHDATAGAGLG